MLLELKIGYLKSFAAPQQLKFSCPSGVRGSGYNVLVGKNNSGKSTAIRLIRELFSDQDTITIGQEARYDSNRPHVGIDWSWQGSTIQLSINSEGTGGYFRKVGEHYSEGARRIKFIPSRRAFSAQFQSTNQTDAHSYDLSDYVNRRNNPGYFDSSFSSSLARVISDPAIGSLVSEHLASIDPRISMIDADNIAERDVIRFKSALGRWHVISDTGDGIINLIRIIHAIVASAAGDCIIVDEPELSLHPQFQKALYKLLVDVSSNIQVIVVTHSPHFVSWQNIASAGNLCRLFLDRVGNSQMRVARREILAAVNQAGHGNVTSRKYYDAVCKELFFSDHAVLVEGPDDVHYISNYLESIGADSLPLMGYGCGGAGNILPWMRLCDELGIRAVAIYDRDKPIEFTMARAEFSGPDANLTSFMLNRTDIRDKFRRNARGKETDELMTEGVFARNGAIHSTAKYAFDFLLRRIRDFLAT